MPVADDLVEVASYSFPHEAHLARANLEAAGIPAFLTDQETIGANWMYSQALGGVRLLVHREHVADARTVLQTDFSAALDDMTDEELGVEDPPEDTSRCSRCGSAQLQPWTSGKKPAYVLWMLLGLPLFFVRRGHKCAVCGNFSVKS